MMKILSAAAYVLFAPVVGGLLAALDRILTARLQGRVGPPLLQSFYDVLKLLQKENLIVHKSQNFYILFFLILVVFTGALFFAGEDILLVIFALTLAEIFFIVGAYRTASPYAHLGAEREMIQIMAYEPALILSAVGLYMITHSFYVSEIAAVKVPIIHYLPGVFLGFLLVLAIKLRKSPFDLSTSHHAHQELVKGITTEFAGPGLAMIEIAHWYETVLLLGFIYLFFAHLPLLGVGVALAVYFSEVFLDNVFARVKWRLLLNSSWIGSLAVSLGNIVVLFLIRAAG
jgi:ech hydrogenase subunit B